LINFGAWFAGRSFTNLIAVLFTLLLCRFSLLFCDWLSWLVSLLGWSSPGKSHSAPPVHCKPERPVPEDHTIPIQNRFVVVEVPE
jgi:hypothetical protein